MNSFNVVIATTGRPTLQRMLDSIVPQLCSVDYLTLIWDSAPTEVVFKGDCNVIQILNEKPLGHWGHASRTRWQNALPGDYLINGDDDDMFAEGAMEAIRNHCTEDKLYVFKMSMNDYAVLPREPQISMANIGTPCGVYKPGGLPEWKLEYGGDFKFYEALSKVKEPVFIDHIIYKVRP